MKRGWIIIPVFLLFMAFSDMAKAEFGDVDIHGFVSQGYLQSTRYNHYYSETEDGTFQFNDMGINFSTKLMDNLRIGMQFFAKDLGQYGNDEIAVSWAFADYRPKDYLGLKVGKFKKPSGLYNASRDVDAARACIFLPPSVYNENNREPVLATKGAALYGLLPFNLEYSFSYGLIDIPENGSVAGRVSNLVGGGLNEISVDASYSFSLFWNTPIEGLKLGGSASDYSFLLDASALNVDLSGDHYIASLEYLYNNLLLAAEWKYTEDIQDIVTDANQSLMYLKRYSEGWYVMGAYRFANWLECGAYYSWFVQDRGDQDGSAQKAIVGGDEEAFRYEDTVLFTRFDINQAWIAKIELHAINGLMEIEYPDATNPANPRKDSILVAAKLTYVF